MKFKEIGTITAAGLLSLAAIVILEAEKPFNSGVQSASGSAKELFQDNARIIESSLPAPTAEPPAGGSAYDENDGGRVVDAPADALEAPTVDVIEAPTGADDEVLESPTPALDDNVSLAGLDESTETIPTFDDTFAEAISEAIGSDDPAAPTATEAAANTSGDEPASIIEETPTGFWLREARLNDVFQHLAQLANRQFFHNSDLDGPSYVVTGQLMNDDPVRQMEELSLMYGVTIHTKGNTVYALTNAQLSTLPTQPFRYSLKYLRPSDIEQIKLILQPFLTPGSGIIEYETKTNTLIVMDNERKLDALSIFLEQIDQPKQQIAIETRILRITSSSRNRIGVDWSSVLGDQGIGLGATSSLNSLFNLPELDTVTKVLTSTGTGSSLQLVQNNRTFTESVTQNTSSNESNLVLSPLEVNAVLRALNAGGLAQQESSPTLITEDNEEGLISIIDRIPIITATISETTAGQNVSEEVRYVIDTADPVGDPTTTREVGVSVSVTPTILPDDTIRMALRPRSAQVVEYIQGQTGNSYPRVNESTVTTTARVPNGHSLLIGGFYEETQSDQTNKVPILGDIPALNLLFKSTDKQKEHTSLVFIVTPRLYRPNVPTESDVMSHEIHDAHILPSDHDYPDAAHPGHSYRSDLRNTTNNIFNKYEPDAPSNILHPAHPYNSPESLPVHGKDESEQPYFESPSVTVRAVNKNERNGGFFGKVFGGNKGNTNR